jgi:hypothetical protein
MKKPEIYYSTGSRPRICVVITACNEPSVLLKNIDHFSRNLPDYRGIVEFSIVDDSDVDIFKKHIDEYDSALKQLAHEGVGYSYYYSALFDHEKNRQYGLARARNIAAFNSTAEFLVFCDLRLTPRSWRDIDALVQPHFSEMKLWTYGLKSANVSVNEQTAFVENFSCVRRFDFVRAGMFSEQVTLYGGLTYETVLRFGKAGFKFVRVAEAVAYILQNSVRRELKEKEAGLARALINKAYFG